MVRFGKKAALLAMAGVLTAASVTGCSGAIDAEATVVTVGKEKVPLGVVNFYARMMQGQYETYYAGMMGTTAEELWTQDAGDDKTYEESVKDSVMEAVENMYLISQHSGEYEVVLTEDEKEAIQKAAEQFDKDNKDESKEAVSGYRKDIEKYLELMTSQSKMSEKMREGVNEEVSDEEAAQKSMEYVYFSYTSTDESGSVTELTDEEKAKAKSTAETIAERAKAGEDFAAVAAELGTEVQKTAFDAKSTSPDAALIEAANALAAEGDVTGAIESDAGVYVAKLTSLLDREATDQKKASIIEERKQEQYDSLLKKWRKETDIKVDKKVWKKVSTAHARAYDFRSHYAVVNINGWDHCGIEWMDKLLYLSRSMGHRYIQNTLYYYRLVPLFAHQLENLTGGGYEELLPDLNDYFEYED